MKFLEQKNLKNLQKDQEIPCKRKVSDKGPFEASLVTTMTCYGTSVPFQVFH